MNNGFLNIFLTKERKRYNRIIQTIEAGNYYDLFYMDNDHNFGLTNNKFINDILNRMERDVLNNVDLLIQMVSSNYHRTFHFMKIVLKNCPENFEKLIDKNVWGVDELIPVALDNGYIPTTDFINSHYKFFSNPKVILKLFELGYKPTNEIVERYSELFGKEEVVIKLLEMDDYVPSLKFIKSANLLSNDKLLDKIFKKVELTPEFINSPAFLGNALAQRKIIETRPDLLLNLGQGSEVFNQFCIEAFKQGNIPYEFLNNYYVNGNYLLFSKVVKQRPELIKYCKIIDSKERDKIDDLALCMGYVPSMEDVRNSEYVKKSVKLMKTVILKRPEAIKYIETRPINDSYSLNISQEDFFDLARLALDNGYIPTIKDIEDNPRLADSFDIMKVLVQEQPEVIYKLRDHTPNKEELFRLALENGFNGNMPTNNGFEDLYFSETGIMYEIEKGVNLDFKNYPNNYSINLYNYLINKGYKIDEIISLFTGSCEVMKEIISIDPNYINSVSKDLTRKEIDELSLLAIDKGYIPKVDDTIFGHGSEIAKVMVKLYPEYIDKVQLFDRIGFLVSAPFESYEEICKMAADGGFIPKLDEIGNGHGGVTTTKYNHSYDIMKKVIPLKPEIIESCDITDKEKYDELCRLAISSGYEVTNEYALTHWGKKMCSNYDLMAKFIAKNPKFILEVEITNADEMLKLIDIAINSGLVLRMLKQNDLLKLFLNVSEEKWSDYLDSYTIEALQKAKELYANNDEIHKTVNPDFLSERISSNFTKSQIEILSCYPKLQEKILKISSNSGKAKIIYEAANKYKDNLEWIPILERTLNNVISSEFANLLGSIDGKELEQKEKDNLMYLLMTDNHLDISTCDELKNIDSIRENYINTLIERNTLGSLKTAYFEKVFGIDLATAIELVNLYGKSLDGDAINSLDEKSREEFVLLENMKKIININNIDVLKYYVENINPEFTIKPDLMMTYEARLKYLFTNEFNKSFTKPTMEDKFISDIEGEKDLDIYLAAGHDGKKKCRMMITSIGAYTNMEEPDDYYASWNVDKIASHGCCCSYVGEKNLGTAEVKYCCLGFTDYELGSLQLSGPYDLCSTSSEDSYEIEAMYESQFLLPDDVLDYTRHTHNETVWERRSISNGKLFKKQPSYIVYFVDNFEDRLSDNEAMRQWESVKKAAENFAVEVDGVKKPLPIMVVEREKIAKSQHEIIQTKLNEFETTYEPKLIKEIISDYESNYAGNRQFHLNISDTYFPKHIELSDSVVGKIIKKITELCEIEPKKAIQCLYELEKAVRNEQEKYNNTKHGVGQSLPSFNIEEALIEINKLKSNFKINKDSIFVMVKDCDKNLRQFNNDDASKITQELLNSQLSSEEVESLLFKSDLSATIALYENEIKDEKINNRLKVHGQRHVKNVLLFSALIGQELVSDPHDLELLLLSAKYHDIGRITDAHEEHSKAGAQIAIEKLKDKCSLEDLAIISTIIEFHEVYRNQPFTDDKFLEIARNNGVPYEEMKRVRQLAEILKDADALDRTRFINKARLNPDFLQYDFSKKLIKFSASLQEKYALEDLLEFNCTNEINALLQIYTPQEVLRTIRHSTRGSLRVEDIQAFIKSWADSCVQKNSELQDMLNESSNTMEVRVDYGK